MTTNDTTTMTSIEAAAHETLVANLRNAHAVEKQVIAVLEPQLDLLSDYPDLYARVNQHIGETREQMRRLDTALEVCGTSTSMVKDALLSVMGLGQSSVQGFASDAVLKAVVADMLTEQLEIATYRSLTVLAEMAGKPELRAGLEASLREEEAMAEWFNQNLEAITRRFVEIKAARDGNGTDSGYDPAVRREAASPETALPHDTLHGSAATSVSGKYRGSEDHAPLNEGMGQGNNPTRPGTF